MVRLKRHNPHRDRPARMAAKLRDEHVTEAAARAVQTGYDVIAKNIKSGREAASRFRDGKYNIRDVPVDLEAMSSRMFQAAGQFSVAAIELGGWLLKAAEPSTKPEAEQTEEPGDNSLVLTVDFIGASKRAEALAQTLTRRPTSSTAPGNLTARLQPHSGTAAAIGPVKFRAALSATGLALVARVPIPRGQPAGVYSGAVLADGEDVPLGLLSIKVLQ